jgi:hypothetical protein
VEKNTSSTEEHLSSEQLTAYTFHLEIEDLERVPAWLCPTCSSREWGGTLRVETGIANQGYYRFVWRSVAPEEVQVFHVLMLDAHVLTQVWDQGDLSPLHLRMIQSPTDLLLSRASTHLLLHMLMGLPQPEALAMRPFDVTALALEARRMWLPPTDLHLRGYFWHPAHSSLLSETREDDVLISFVSASPPPAQHDPFSLVARWQRIFERSASLL